MDTRKEHDAEIRAEHPEVYEPPMLDEIGGFTALTRADSTGLTAEQFGYYAE
ncbi:MAG: lasso RiPP family leader peptide-containing protein [Pseudonocardiaceae bacterium]